MRLRIAFRAFLSRIFLRILFLLFCTHEDVFPWIECRFIPLGTLVRTGWHSEYGKRRRRGLSRECCNLIWNGRVFPAAELRLGSSSRSGIEAQSRNERSGIDAHGRTGSTRNYFFPGTAAGGGAIAGGLARTVFTAGEILSAFCSRTLTCHN